MADLSPKLSWEQANPKWAAALNPLLALSLVNGQQIDGIILSAGVPFAVYHSLGQKPSGWFVVDTNAATTVFRTQPFSPKTLTLQSSANATISIWVY